MFFANDFCPEKCRNLLSPEYHGITEEKLFSLIHQIATIREFVDVMQKKSRIKNNRFSISRGFL